MTLLQLLKFTEAGSKMIIGDENLDTE